MYASCRSSRPVVLFQSASTLVAKRSTRWRSRPQQARTPSSRASRPNTTPAPLSSALSTPTTAKASLQCPWHSLATPLSRPLEPLFCHQCVPRSSLLPLAGALQSRRVARPNWQPMRHRRGQPRLGPRLPRRRRPGLELFLAGVERLPQRPLPLRKLPLRPRTLNHRGQTTSSG